MRSTWDALLGDDREHALRDDLERTWGRLTEASRASVTRLEHATADNESLDSLQTVWALHHALDGRVVVVGGPLGLILHAATKGSAFELAHARLLAARAARALSRSHAIAVIERGWVAVALPAGRSLSVDADAGDLRPLMALLIAARAGGRNEKE